jgi:hypothetical protein
MITIENDESGINHVKAFVTDFTDSMGYCEYKIPFFIQDTYVKTEPMIIGAEYHEEVERIERETAITVPLTEKKLKDKKSDLSFLREDIQTQFVQEFDLPKGKAKLTLFGRADKIIRENETLLISDDKRTSRPERHSTRMQPYDDQLLQVLTYLHSKYYLGTTFGGWIDIPHIKKKYQINIVDSKTKSIYKTYEDIVNKNHIKLLMDYTSKFTQKCLQLETLVHHNSKMKCKACGFFDDCSKAIK